MKKQLFVSLIVLAGYLFLLPYINHTWRTTGDEPHYLLTMHSLAADGDLDLANNYEQFDYLDFYLSKDIIRQTRTDAAGREILDHYLGLPILAAPAYRLGGRLGVLLAQLVIGAILAGFIFRLAFFFCGQFWPAFAATLCIAFSPPLLMYNYLIYPEIWVALLTMLVIYYLLTTDQPTPLIVMVVWFALLTMPWFNRRFIALALSLILFLIWFWSEQETPLPKRFLNWRIAPGVGLFIVSLGLLFLFNSQLSTPERIDVALPPSTAGVFMRVARGIGWFLDQQRGLFIFGPIYLGAVFGLPFLGLSRHKRRWLVLWPFVLSWGTITLAGGYWVAWEVGPRFLVVALPFLAPLLAMVWQRYAFSKIGGPLLIGLTLISLLNSIAIIREPELPYKSSLPLYYQQMTGLPVTSWLPQLGEHLTLTPAQDNQGTADIIELEGVPQWVAEAGQAHSLVEPDPFYSLPFGHYTLSWPLQFEPGLAPKTEVIRITTTFLGGGQLFSHIITPADLPTDGAYGEFAYDFFNPNVDRWRTPPVFRAVSTGQSQVQAKTITIRPDWVYAWLLPYLYGGFLLLGLVWLWWSVSLVEEIPSPILFQLHPAFLGVAGGGVLLALWLLVQAQSQTVFTYHANDLFHISGEPITDSASHDGRAWFVDHQVHHPGKAIYGPFDFYEPGEYEVTYQLKLTRPTETTLPIALLQVKATANFDDLITQPLLASHFSEVDYYHQFVLTFHNPRRQALSFEVDYLGEAPFILDEMVVKKKD